jgi:hypothetical protein
LGLRQLEVRLRVQQIYVGLPIRIDGAPISPVGRCAAYPLNEGKCRDPVPPDYARQNRTAQVVSGLPLGVLPQYLPQDREAEQIDPHRGQQGWSLGCQGIPLLWLVYKQCDLPQGVGSHHAKLGGLVTGHREGGHHHIRTALLLELQQVTVVHVIDMIAAQDQHMRRVDALQEGEVLVHRIRRP